MLGLPVKSSDRSDALKHALANISAELTRGDAKKCLEIVAGLYAGGHRVSEICDLVIAPACYAIGQQWECGEVEIYQERRACELCLQLLAELSRLVQPPTSLAPLAIGGTPTGDPYSLPTRMVELVFRERGWRAQSLGSSLPFQTLSAAVDDLQPDVLWISVSHLENREQFLTEYRAFFRRVKDRVAVVVGGQALDETLRRQIEYAAHCDNLQHLESFAAALKKSVRPKKRKALPKSSAN
jgi:methanogenic corrinoid protein MtbC1